MLRRVSVTRFAALVLGVGFAFSVLAPHSAAAQPGKKGGSCVLKAASGTNFSKDGAMFQAWEAVLQATDWGSWATFMSGKNKIGTAPGYKVSKLKSRCGKGGIGYSCRIQAKLCK